jgi:protein-S-isoprenylcysteine O-methyltransferase Ste14
LVGQRSVWHANRSLRRSGGKSWFRDLGAHENPFASSVLRIQTERGHRVITTGPYALVRHPIYLAAAILFITSGMALGSWFATAWGAFFVPLLLNVYMS